MRYDRGWLGHLADGRLVDDADGVVRRVAAMIVSTAQQLVPVRTGALRASIFMVTSQQGGDSRFAGLAPAVVPRGTAWIVAGQDYAAYVEYGTRRSRPRPYFRPAFSRGEAEMERALADLGRGLR